VTLPGASGKHGDGGRLNGLDSTNARYNFSTGMHTGVSYGLKI